MKQILKIASASLLATGMMLTPLAAHAQQNIEPRGAANNPATDASSYTKEQLITATVHQAWLISGKNEEKFFDMVQELAQMSALNRGITLPDDAAAGRRMGDYIKQSAKADTDQLLYAVVDKAVVMVTRPAVHKAGQTHK